jgi:hypothetical protein
LFYVPSARRKLGSGFEGFFHLPFGISLCSQCKKELRVRVLRGLFTQLWAILCSQCKKEVRVRVLRGLFTQLWALLGSQ